MKTKFHFGLLVVLFAFLGTYIEQTTLPNQQIVIQFSDHAVSSEDTENAIEVIQSKLQRIGVTHIQIGQNNDGQLRITYHSDADVAQIQKILYNVEDFKISYDASQNQSNHLPKESNLKDYELNISEIKTSSSNTNWDFEGTQVTELNHKTDRLSYPKTNNSGELVNIFYTKNSIEVATLLQTTVAIAIDNHSFKIPEVRAGPLS